jgi:hypothetical protein
MLKVSAMFLTVCLATVAMGNDRRDPVGEVAKYKLDKSGGRTSMAVSKGAISTTVARTIDDQNGKSYGVKIDYDVTLKITGSFKDSFEMVFPENFFTPDFIDNLRNSGSYVSDQYKITYDGQADASNSDGRVFPKADLLTIYDIKVDGEKGLYRLLCIAAGFDPDEVSVEKALPMANMKIKAHVYQGIPALSSVKLDLSGKIKGIPTKLGFDLE